MEKRTRIALLGSTGSIGGSTLDVVRRLKDRFEIVTMAAGRRIDRLVEQIIEFSPKYVAVAGPSELDELRSRWNAGVSGPLPELGCGTEGLIDCVEAAEIDFVVAALVGALGLPPTYRALELGKCVTLANKETLVVAGQLMTRKAKETGAALIPIDSEHNALHQCLHGASRSEVARLVLTASGGPFRALPAEDFSGITVEAALRHPTWVMGPKITIDCATLMNKGLEVIEASWLFGFPAEQIDVLIHPQSIVHSMVEFVDGSMIAQLGVTDMRFAIQYALTYPERMPTSLPRLDLAGAGRLEFESPDFDRFPCLGLAYEAMSRSGTAPAVLNAANEVAVQAFLDGGLTFTEIPRMIRRILDEHIPESIESLDHVLGADQWARSRARRLLSCAPRWD
ncbi:MAG: 1-deoxy-D-xylulose-5-phosphate reductoisomerase [Acidobacteria bacterium]|nr:1-deoxy-D-xylulose-5-phosphate reductoisomerase [Acidobacteriota bacterium]